MRKIPWPGIAIPPEYRVAPVIEEQGEFFVHCAQVHRAARSGVEAMTPPIQEALSCAIGRWDRQMLLDQAASSAASKGDLIALTRLLEAGADAAQGLGTRVEVRLPLSHICALFGHRPCLSLLLARPDAPPALSALDAGGRSALMLAVFLGHNDCALSLLQAGAPVELADTQGARALRYAALARNFVGIELLLGFGADPEPQDELGRSAFSDASEQVLGLLAAHTLARELQASLPFARAAPRPSL